MARDEHESLAAESFAEQRVIDAEVRDSEAELDCDELRDEHRSVIERGVLADEIERLADERDIRLDDREQQLTDRERRAELRELDLGERESEADERERAADEREINQAERS